MTDTIQILYVDDEPDLLTIGKIFLEQHGDFTVTTETSARQAIELLTNTSFDVIISDYQMPDMDGIVFLKLLKSTGDATPFILFTGRGREEVVIDALNNGADFYLQKGGDPQAQFLELEHTIRHAVSHRRAELSLLDYVEDLRKASSRYEVLIAASNTGAWEFHTNSGYVWCSPEYFTMLGRTAPEIDTSDSQYINHMWRDLLHPDDRDQAVSLFDTYLKNPKGMYEQTFRMHHKDGTWIWILSRGKALPDPDGKPSSIIVGTHIDISEQKEAEEKIRNQYETLAATEADLRQTKESLENLITIANVPILIWDASFRITHLNHACERLIGRSAEEIIGTSPEFLFPPHQADRSLRLFRTTQDGVRWETVEIDIQHVDGSVRTVLWNSATLYTPDGNDPISTIAQGRDVTEERRLEKEKDAALVQIQHNLAQLAILNDEIRNPLSIISGYADLAGDQEIVDQIILQVQRIDDIVNQLDQRWMESEKVLTAIRSHYHLYVSPSPQIVQPDKKDTGNGLPGADSGSHGGERGVMLEEIQAQLYSILDSIDAVIYVADMENYEILYMNRVGRGLFGDSISRKCYNVLHKEQIEPCSFCTNRYLDKKSGSTGVYNWEHFNNLNNRWYDCRDRVIRWTDGRLVRLEVATDITRRKQNETALLIANERIRHFIDTSIVGVILASPSGTIEEANDCFLGMIGYSREEFEQGMVDWRKITPPEWLAADEHAIIELREKGVCTPYEKEYVRRDGTRVSVFLSDTMMPGEQEEIVALVIDITERKNAVESLNETNKKLRLLTGLTRHDTLNSLFALQGYHDLIQETTGSGEVLEYVSQAQKAVKRIESIIGFTREYEDFGEASSGWQPLWQIIESAIQEVAPDSIQTENHIPPDMKVYADPIIRKVFTTLIENAVRHGGDDLSRVSLSWIESEEKLIIICEDDGAGIPEHEKEYIFDHWYGKNTGVGLFLAREILSITGLSIRECGTEGKGARFEIMVPPGKWRVE